MCLECWKCLTGHLDPVDTGDHGDHHSRLQYGCSAPCPLAAACFQRFHHVLEHRGISFDWSNLLPTLASLQDALGMRVFSVPSELRELPSFPSTDPPFKASSSPWCLPPLPLASPNSLKPPGPRRWSSQALLYLPPRPWRRLGPPCVRASQLLSGPRPSLQRAPAASPSS